MLEQSQFLLELRSFLIKHWHEYGLEGNPSGLTYRMRQAPLARADRSRMVALWFHDNPEKPSVVTKWGLSPNSGAFTLQEHRHAQWLYEKKSLHFIPKPLDCPTLSGIPVLIEAAVLGRSFAHRLLSLPLGQESERQKVRLTLESIFEKSAEILSKIQDPLIPVEKQQLVIRLDPYLSKASTALGWSPEKINKIKTIFLDKITTPVPGSGKTLMSGDFAPQHLIESEQGTFLIDLEFSLESLMAFLDPLTLVYRTFRLLNPALAQKDNSEAVRCFEAQVFNENHDFGAVSARFLESRGLSRNHFAWYWMVFFLHEAVFQHFVLDHFSAPESAFFNAFISRFSNELEGSLHPTG